MRPLARAVSNAASTLRKRSTTMADSTVPFRQVTSTGSSRYAWCRYV
jgi:hypothetical protein